MTDRRPLVYRDAVHQPLDVADRLDVPSIPVSRSNTAHNNHNEIQTPAAGLYVGPMVDNRINFYVSEKGEDVWTEGVAGTRDHPFKTLDFALTWLQGMMRGEYIGNVNLALKCGETFSMNQYFAVYNGLTITFWGDPQYGDFDSPPINMAVPAVMADLSRPVINMNIVPGTVGGMASFLLYTGPYVMQPHLTFQGVKINLAQGRHETGAVDAVTGVTWTDSKVQLYGAIVNITDPTSAFGFYGLEAWCEGSLYQFNSQFTVMDQKVGAGASPAVLQARKNFLKLYPDFRGAIQTGLDLYGGSPGSAIMKLSWSDVPVEQVTAGKTNLGSYPYLNDPAYGMTNYFFNLYRNSVGQPTNVLSSRPF